MVADRAGTSGGPSSFVMIRSHSAFAIVANGFNRTSFHGFLAKRLLLRGGRLLKHIGVAAVVAAREINGCGFPAQVAVNTLVIDVKLSGHVFRVFIRNVGHKILFRFMHTDYALPPPPRARKSRLVCSLGMPKAPPSVLVLGRRYILVVFDDRPEGLLSHADGSGLLPEARPKLTDLSWEEIRLALMLDIGCN